MSERIESSGFADVRPNGDEGFAGSDEGFAGSGVLLRRSASRLLTVRSKSNWALAAAAA
jgi:hypothetical protein